MKQNAELPGWFRILNGLISEIAKESGEDPEEFKEALFRNSGKAGPEDRGRKKRELPAPQPLPMPMRAAITRGDRHDK
jgi:hypothetical protein